jgi:hypothetical protein
MNVFEYNGSKYITINGKSFYLMRGYSRDRGELVFVQVTGNNPLFIEDMPDTKKWRLAKSKCRDCVVYIVFNNEYHNYASDRANGKLLFPAPTSAGSFFLLLRHINEKFGFNLSEEELLKVPEETRYDLISKVRDQGNSDIDIYMLNLSDNSEERFKEILLPKPEVNDGNEVA